MISSSHTPFAIHQIFSSVDVQKKNLDLTFLFNVVQAHFPTWEFGVFFVKVFLLFLSISRVKKLFTITNFCIFQHEVFKTTAYETCEA